MMILAQNMNTMLGWLVEQEGGDGRDEGNYKELFDFMDLGNHINFPAHTPLPLTITGIPRKLEAGPSYLYPTRRNM